MKTISLGVTVISIYSKNAKKHHLKPKSLLETGSFCIALSDENIKNKLLSIDNQCSEDKMSLCINHFLLTIPKLQEDVDELYQKKRHM